MFTSRQMPLTGLAVDEGPHNMDGLLPLGVSLVFRRVRELNPRKLMRGGANMPARKSWQNIFW